MQNGFQHYDRSVVDALFHNFTTELEEIKFAHPEVLIYAKQSVDVAHRYLEQLKEIIKTHDFSGPGDEIDFFKRRKPLFLAALIYYAELYNVELRKPQGSKQQLEEFYMDEYDRIHLFFGMHNDIYRYYKSESSHLDHIYFIRGNAAHSIAVHYAEIDTKVSTGYDMLVARFRANDMLADYLAKEVERLQQPANSKGRFMSELNWTAPISGFAEFVVALDAHAVFNNAPMGIGKLAKVLAGFFNLDPINIHKKYEEIRIRKKNRTVFLDALKSSLIRKMELDDENAL